MNIISKFKDYYDHIAHVYGGGDPQIVYIRKALVDRELIDGLWFTHPKQVSLNSNLRLPYSYDFHFEYLVIAGKSYLLAQTQATAYTARPRYSLFSVMPEEAQKKFFSSRARYRAATPYLYEDGCQHPDLLNLSKKLQAPVFKIEKIQADGKDTKKAWFNITGEIPVLAEITGLSKILAPEQAYQEISYFVGNLMKSSPDMSPPVQVSDKDRLIQHGFDIKTSFRHR